MSAQIKTTSFLLSKTSFLEGRQCPLRLWLRAKGISEIPSGVEDYHDPTDDFSQQAREFELVVQQMYPFGIDVADLAHEKGCSRYALSQELLANLSTTSLFQAELRTDRMIAYPDILERDGHGWIMGEVKASTSMKPIFFWDLAFQWLLLEECGCSVTQTLVFLLNKDYVYSGNEHDVQELVLIQDCTAEVKKLLPQVVMAVEEQIQVIDSINPPQALASHRCKGNRQAKEGDRPSDCGHLHEAGHCGQGLPANWAFQLPRLTKAQKEHLAEQDTPQIDGISLEDESVAWTDQQQTVIRVVQRQEAWVDHSNLRERLAQLEWPLAFMDFEFDPGLAVPKFEGMSPYQNLPFQWSLQIQASPDSLLVDVDPFLHTSEEDPREPFLDSLLAALPAQGSVVVHYQQAEWGVLKNYLKWFPGKYEEQLVPMRERFFDTCRVARDTYYHPTMKGSWSIKSLGPALLGRGYEDLEIQDGMTAVRNWRELITSKRDPLEAATVRSKLLAYCLRDTQLMFDMLEEFRRLIRRPR